MHHLTELIVENVQVSADNLDEAFIVYFLKLPHIKRLRFCNLEDNQGSLEQLLDTFARVLSSVKHLAMDPQPLRPENVLLSIKLIKSIKSINKLTIERFALSE